MLAVIRMKANILFHDDPITLKLQEDTIGNGVSESRRRLRLATPTNSGRRIELDPCLDGNGSDEVIENVTIVAGLGFRSWENV